MLLRRGMKGKGDFILDYMIFILCEFLSELLHPPILYKGGGVLCPLTYFTRFGSQTFLSVLGAF